MESTPTEQEKTSQNLTISDEQIREKRRLFKPNEKIRVTKSGIVFSGPSASSDIYRRQVTYKNKGYDKNEHAIQCTKAEVHNKPALSEELKKISGSFEVKQHANENITATAKWNAEAPNLIEEIFENKFEQNPELRLRLISTYPLPLVEGSTRMKWRGGVPFDSILYDTAKIPGPTNFGKSTTKYRNKKYHELSKS